MTRPSARVRRLGLRRRATVAFAAVTLGLSVLMAVTMYAGVSAYLLEQRERLTLAQTVDNAAQVQRGLEIEGISVPEVLSQLSRGTGSSSVLRYADQWFTTELAVGTDDLPEGIRALVDDGQAGRQRFAVQGQLHLVVGVPLGASDAAYFEIFPLSELDRTHEVLSTALLAAVLLSPLLGLLLGSWAANRALKPLTDVASAAGAVAQGDLDTRIDPRGDPDLASIAGAFNETTAALQRRVRGDARFASDVSHELRSPLTTMLNAISLFGAHRTALPEDAVEVLGLLEDEVRRFERLVTDLLEISRDDAGVPQLLLEDVQLADLVTRAVPPPLASRVTVASGAEDVSVRTDKRRLERIVANLVENAEKHGEGVVGITLQVVDGSVRCTVEDAGHGVPPEERDRVFERFARGRGSGRDSTEGSGLGLALVDQHVRLLGGTVRVEDRPGGGARFVVMLPREVGR